MLLQLFERAHTCLAVGFGSFYIYTGQIWSYAVQQIFLIMHDPAESRHFVPSIVYCDMFGGLIDLVPVVRFHYYFSGTELEKVKEEKEGFEFKIAKFEKSAKDLDQLLANQHPLGLILFGLEKFKQPETDSSSVKSPLKVDKDWKEKFFSPANQVREEEPKKSRENNDAPIIKDWVSDDEDNVEPISKVEKKTCYNLLLLRKRRFLDSGCSRHMSGNIAHLLDFKDFDGGYVTFGGGENGGRITGKYVANSDDASAGDNENPLLGTSLLSLPEAGKKFRLIVQRKLPSRVGDSLLKVRKIAAQVSKMAGEASDPLDVDNDADIHAMLLLSLRITDCHWVVAHVTPPSWKEHLREISIKQLCDIHDRAYMRQVVLDNVLNSRTLELISALYKVIASYDAIRARELEKDRAYAELERKCNEALLDLTKNPLVADLRTEIETLQRRVDGLHSKCTRLEMDALKQDRASVVAKVVPDAATKLIHSDEMGMLVAKLVKASIIYGRCATFEEVSKLKEPFVMDKMVGYRPSSKQEYNQAGDDLVNASRANVFDFKGLMRGPSSPLRRFILLDNVNLGV
ncbi:hypothetical protein Tco_0857026 [Tanacetum coccineum]|uniref:Uncharacterized protein n=1 Tax=Tanacetum coccineum TaxID=301880 RepID=A0ABQ5BAN8_9ASTR